MVQIASMLSHLPLSLVQAGIHSSVLNMISSFGPTTSIALCVHMNVDKVIYTYYIGRLRFTTGDELQKNAFMS